MQRRDFLGLVVWVGIPTAAGCSSGEDHGNDGCKGAGAETSLDSGHRHSVCVPPADLESPPSAGGTYETTTDEGHLHTVSLSAEQLAALQAGQTVVLQTSLDDGHTHSVTFASGASVGGGY